MAEDERRTWWMYRGRFFWEDDGLAPDEVMALVHERDRRLRRRIDRAKDLMLAEAADARARGASRSPRTCGARSSGATAAAARSAARTACSSSTT